MEKIFLEDWIPKYFRKGSSRICNPDVGGDCWFIDKEDYCISVSLSLRKPIQIKQDWPNPYLVFWHKYQLPRGRGELIINKLGGSSDYLFIITTGGSTWKKVAINLDKYKGEQILLVFNAWYAICGLLPARIAWYLQNIHIDPNYQP